MASGVTSQGTTAAQVLLAGAAGNVLYGAGMRKYGLSLTVMSPGVTYMWPEYTEARALSDYLSPVRPARNYLLRLV